MEVGNEIINLKNGVNSKASQTSVTNLTNRVTTTETKINDLYNMKADKTQLDAAKTEAITTSNDYTNTKVGALETKVNTEVKRLDDRIDNLDSKVNTEVSRLDGRIDATNQNVTNLSNKVTTEVARVDKRIDATNTTVEANKKEAADATAKVQSNLDKESKRLDMKIDTETQRVESKFNQRITELDTRLNNRIDNVLTYVGNEFRAINNRIDGLGAMTVALSTAATSSVYNPEKPTNVNFATGYYGRSGALALGVSHFLSSNTKLSVNYAAGSFTKSAVGLGVGFCF
jgi:predicted  nucleic acid-binding Zn-ribbon protein